MGRFPVYLWVFYVIVQLQGLFFTHSLENESPVSSHKKSSHQSDKKTRYNLQLALKHLSNTANLIYQRFEFHNWKTFQFFLESSNMPIYAWDLIKYKLAMKIMSSTNSSSYLMIFGGSSVTAGHDNYYNESYPFVFERRLTKAFSALGIQLLVHNIAQGANNCRPSDHCYDAMGGENADFMTWEQSFNCGRSKDVQEFMARYAYWNGAVMYYIASGAFLPDYCAPSKDPIPWISENWTPEKAGLTAADKHYDLANNQWDKILAYRDLQNDWYNDGNSVSRFTNQVYGGLYKGVGPHGYSVWGHSSHLCNNGSGCDALNMKGECYEKGGPHWMTKEASYYAGNPSHHGKSWHPPTGMHLLRGEVLAYNFAHILADTIYMILNDTKHHPSSIPSVPIASITSSAASSADKPAMPVTTAATMQPSSWADYYHQKWVQLRVPIPINPLHTKSEEGKVLPMCFTDFTPHFNPLRQLSKLILGNYTEQGWHITHGKPDWQPGYGYQDERPYFEAHEKDKEISFRIPLIRLQTVRICGYARKDSLKEVNYYLDPFYPFTTTWNDSQTVNANIAYQPTSKRIEIEKKEFVGDDCYRLSPIPNGGEHVLTVKTTGNRAVFISHIVLF